MWIFGTIIVSLIYISNCRDLDVGCMYREDMTDISMNATIINVLQKGNLHSPGFEDNQNYPNLIKCSYQLKAPTGMHVRLHFNVLDIYAMDGCSANFLAIIDIHSEGIPSSSTLLCGNQIPYDYVSQSSAINLIFITDDYATRKGFSITYSIQTNADVCAQGLKQCGNRNCIDYGRICDGEDDCGDGTDEENCRGIELQNTVCGKPEIDPLKYVDHDRIVGGQKAVEGSWPWVADLNIKRMEPSAHMCGGALINEQWVLTAAHCFISPGARTAKDWRIHLGNYRKYDKEIQEQVRYAERIVIYDDIPSALFEVFGNFNITHDMALVKLNAPVKVTKYVQPVCLPKPSLELTSRSNCYVVGWGSTRGTGNSDVLKQAFHPIQSGYNCRRDVYDHFNNDTMICAGSMDPLNGACHGDSGGPLTCKLDGVWEIAGVVSYSPAFTGETGLCGLKGNPTAFNKVSAKIDWIHRIINRYS